MRRGEERLTRFDHHPPRQQLAWPLWRQLYSPPRLKKLLSPLQQTSPLPNPTHPSSATSAAHAHIFKARWLALKRAKAALTAICASQRAAVLA